MENDQKSDREQYGLINWEDDWSGSAWSILAAQDRIAREP